MESALSCGPSQGNGTRSSSDDSLLETVSRMEKDINNLIGALALLGIGRCSRCRQFFQRSDPGALFDCGKTICYGCIPDWWTSVSAQVSVNEREQIEGKLAPWLRKYHHAQVVKDGPGAPDIREGDLQIVTCCIECRGTGKILQGERCRFCNGLGTVRIVVPK
jgi:hypothetical protein